MICVAIKARTNMKTATPDTVSIRVPAVIASELAKHRITPKRFLRDILQSVAEDDEIGEAIRHIYRRDKPGWIAGLVIIQGE